MKKRCYALLLAIMLVFGTILPETALTAVTVEAAAYSYNPDAAVAYAEKYWTNYNDFYPNYNIFGGDCADFVSFVKCHAQTGAAAYGWIRLDAAGRTGL